MLPPIMRKLFSLIILWCSLLISLFCITYLTLQAAGPDGAKGEFTIYIERMLGVAAITGWESGQVKNTKRLGNQEASYYQKLIWNCVGGYMISVNADGSIVCGSPVIPLPPPPFTCAVTPTYTDATFFIGTPTIVNQPWSQTGPNCKYTCTSGYSGPTCAVAPVVNSCAAAPACTSYWGCTTTAGSPTSIGQPWSQAGTSCTYSCNAGYTGPACAPLGAFSCPSSPQTWNWSGQGWNCSALIPAGYTISDNQTTPTSPTVTLANTAAGYFGSVTWKCIDSDPVVGTTAVEWVFAWGSCSAMASCASPLPTCNGSGCTTNVGTPTSTNQTWSKWATSCGFSCNSGYSGPDCDPINIPSTCNFTHSLATSLTAHPTYPWICEPAIDGQEVWKFTAAMIGVYYKVKCICTSTLDAPIGLTGVAGNASVSLSWTAPSGTITDYIVEYKATASATWLVFADGVSTATTANVTGLTNGTSYDFQVKAKNTSGESGPSNVASITPIGSGTCGQTNNIAQFSYPSWVWACTSWSQIDIDVTAIDGVYNWRCDTVSCNASRLTWASSTYLGCDIFDLNLPDGSTWASCNVWAIISDVSSLWSFGNLYQWWRNTPFPAYGLVSTMPWLVSEAVANSETAFILGAASTYTTDWVTPQNDNLWWWRTNPMTWVFSSVSPGNQILMQWPCSAGYHVPTYKEWTSAFSSIDSNTTWAVFSNKDDVDIRRILRLPLPGFRDHRNGWTVTGSYWFGRYWSSWPGAWWGGTIYINLNASSVWMEYGTRADAYPVRCVKDTGLPLNSCAPAPACIAAGQCTQTANSPTSVGQAWANGWAQCGYTCSGGWSGGNCDVAASPSGNSCTPATAWPSRWWWWGGPYTLTCPGWDLGVGISWRADARLDRVQLECEGWWSSAYAWQAGGWPYYRYCPSGKYLIGFAGRSGLRVDSLEPICASIDGSNKEMLLATPNWGWGWHFIDECPAGSAVYKLEWREGAEVDEIKIFCKPPTNIAPLFCAAPSGNAGCMARIKTFGFVCGAAVPLLLDGESYNHSSTIYDRCVWDIPVFATFSCYNGELSTTSAFCPGLTPAGVACS